MQTEPVLTPADAELLSFLLAPGGGGGEPALNQSTGGGPDPTAEMWGQSDAMQLVFAEGTRPPRLQADHGPTYADSDDDDDVQNTAGGLSDRATASGAVENPGGDLGGRNPPRPSTGNGTESSSGSDGDMDDMDDMDAASASASPLASTTASPSGERASKASRRSGGAAGKPAKGEVSVKREQNRQASRTYRQRKKEYLQGLESEVERLRLQNDELQRENSKLKQQGVVAVESLQRHVEQQRKQQSQQQTNTPDNVQGSNGALTATSPTNIAHSELRRTESSGSHGSSGSSAEQELQGHDNAPSAVDVLSDIQKALGQGTSNEVVAGLLQKLRQSCHARLHTGLPQLINPLMMTQLAVLSLGCDDIGTEDNAEADTQMRLAMESVGVPRDHQQRVINIRQEHHQKLNALLWERQKLVAELRQFFKARVQPFTRMLDPTPSSMPMILDTSTKMEQLRANLQRQEQLVEESYRQLSSVLEPRVEAALMVRMARSSSSSLQMLHSLWSVTQNDAARQNIAT